MNSFRMYPTVNADELIEEVRRRTNTEMRDFDIIERLVGDNYSNSSFKEFDIVEVVGDALASFHFSKSAEDGRWFVITNCIADILDALAPGQHLWLLDVSW